jgi:hypothetical protein
VLILLNRFYQYLCRDNQATTFDFLSGNGRRQQHIHPHVHLEKRFYSRRDSVTGVFERIAADIY